MDFRKIVKEGNKYMKMKLNDVLVLNDTFKTIIDNDKESKIDSLCKFRLLGIMKNLEIPVNNFEIIRNDKIKEYGKANEDGNISISADDEASVKKFTDDLNKVLLSDVDVTIEKLKVKDVFSAGVPSEYLVRLYGIMEE